MPMSGRSGVEAIDGYLQLTESGKIIFLALVSGRLTVHGRAFGLDLSGERQVGAFKGLNELQHLICFHIAGIGMKSHRYPDDIFLQILFEKATLFDLANYLTESFEWARTHSIRT